MSYIIGAFIKTPPHAGMLAMGLFSGGESPKKIPGLVHDWRYLLSNPMPSSNEYSGTESALGKERAQLFFLA